MEPYGFVWCLLLALMLAYGLAAKAAATEAAPGVKPANISCPAVQQVPVIDGKLGDTIWREATQVDGFIKLGGTEPAAEVTRAWIMRYGETLYLGFDFDIAPGRSPKSVPGSAGCDTAWQGEDIEIFFVSPDRLHSLYQVFIGIGGAYNIVNHGGATVDVNQIKVATARRNNGWTAEAAVPLSSINSAVGQALKVQFARGHSSLGSWSGSSLIGESAYNETDRYPMIDWQAPRQQLQAASFNAAFNAWRKSVRQWEFFGKLNLNNPKLAKVRIAAEARDLDSAQSALLAYYRQRNQPVISHPLWWSDGLYPLHTVAFFYFPPNEVPAFTHHDRRKLAPMLNISRPMADDPASILSKLTPLDAANAMLQDTYFNSYTDEPLDMGQPWDWAIIRDNNVIINEDIQRFRFMYVLAQVYWSTGQEQYAQKAVALWQDWLHRATDPDRRRSLAPLYQAALQPAALEMLIDSPAMTPQLLCEAMDYLTSEVLVWHISQPRATNQLLGQGQTLLALAYDYPEFRDAKKWAARGREYVNMYIKTNLYPDGTFAEASPSYIVEDVSSLGAFAELCNRVGMESAYDSDALVRAWVTFFSWLARPDGYYPWLGDGGKVDKEGWQGVILPLAQRLGDPELIYAATCGRQGITPTQMSRLFPWSGYVVMRDEFGGQENYLLFEAGPFGANHAHADKLAVNSLSAYGRTILEDIGIHTYSPSNAPEFQAYSPSTNAHSSVIVDDKSQQFFNEYATGPAQIIWHSDEAIDFAEAAYQGRYVTSQSHRLFEADPTEAIRHQRSVLYVKSDYWVVTDNLAPVDPASIIKHTYEQLFHFAPMEVVADAATQATWSKTPDQPNLAIIPVGREGLEVEIVAGRTEPSIRGWYYAPGSDDKMGHPRVPSPCVTYRREGTRGEFQTILFPQKIDQSDRPTVTPLGQTGWCKITFADGRYDIVAAPPQSGVHSLDGLSFKGRAMIVRYDATGKQAAHHIVDQYRR